MLGGTGRDTLDGGGGNDTLFGLADADVLTGGAGADEFHFGSEGETGLTPGTRDVITDFSTAEGDRIHLASMDAIGTRTGNQAFTFLGTDAFSSTDAAGQLRYEHDGATGRSVLYGSTDADAAPEFAIELIGVGVLSATDIFL
jgi:Ca2+-binding RTX toxin-like protein